MEVSLPLVALPKPYVKLPQRQSGGDFLYPRNVMRYMDRHLESSDQCAFGFSIQKTLIVYDLSKIPYYAPGIGPESLILYPRYGI